ncbi:MAG: ABC transporter permease subunit [Bacteroidetes bacterium]|jgi:ABC-2 type transport system permease protein|nr:ABC transporter permease subunit [Bacteroidota bacterium]MBT3751421.1 ABC transporter permease subunit [Bacteroidota bacterium]MBT4399368.1 ABC transporter permease subunit [Bacteroidota bacterium]MBT4411921.1 ABC transporter permease subunit [Bacteroidota bacterium]MBT5425989.1 ABC transporter permease subunit [Bacteroidota bacterium]
MREIWILARRELRSFFNSLIAYILLVAFLGFSGFFTWISGADIFMVGQASLQSFFGIAYWTLFFFIPGLTMGQLAEENRSGTIELLLTKPISDWQVIIGKFLSTWILIAIALAFTIPYYITVSTLGPIDHGAVWAGYLALLLMSASYIAIGLFASSISNNQIVGFLLALLIGIFFHIIFNILSASFTGLLGNIMHYLSLSTHFESISRGVIDTKDLIYFFSLIALGLAAAEFVITRRRT